MLIIILVTLGYYNLPAPLLNFRWHLLLFVAMMPSSILGENSWCLYYQDFIYFFYEIV